MRIFVKYNRDGEILSVSKVTVMPEHLDQPYSLLDESESVLEVPAMGDYVQLNTLQIHEGYEVDTGQKTLVKRTRSAGESSSE